VAATATHAPERVRIIYNALSGSMMPLWVGVESGAFREHGLDVELLFIESGTTAAQALVSGEAPLGHLGAAALVGPVAEGLDLAIFQATAQVPPLTLFTRDDLALPDGLRGGRVGVTRFGSSTDVVGRLLLRRWGLEPERDATLLQLGSVPEMVGALQSGAVDAAVLSDPSSFRAARLGFRAAADAGELNIPYLHLGTAATRALLASQPELIRRYLLGYHAGLRRFFADPELTKRALASYTRQDDAELLEQTYRLHAEKYISRDLRPRAETVETILSTASHPRARELPPEALIDDRPVRQLEAEGLLPALR
jgi:NitT/TauT family transport system substrate-binding protein